MTGSGELLIMLALIAPLFAACIGLSIITITMFVRTGAGAPPHWVLARPLAGLEIAFRLEPLGALFALMARVLWGVNSLFSIGYMRGKREANRVGQRLFEGQREELDVRAERRQPVAAHRG